MVLAYGNNIYKISLNLFIRQDCLSLHGVEIHSILIWQCVTFWINRLMTNMEL